jgi:exodeoxyribonuclease-3
MKIATWNVNGIRARAAEVEAWLAREAPDVVCLQEIKAPADKVPVALFCGTLYHCFWHGFKGYSGVALLLRRERFPDAPAFFHPPFDDEHRIVAATVAGTTYASVYVPNGGKDFPAKLRFLEAMERWAGELTASGGRLVLCGDFNVARSDLDVHPKERGPGVVGQLPEERALIDRLLAHGLVDVQRALEPTRDDLFTWWAPWRQRRERNIGWRLDLVVVSSSLFRPGTTCTSHREVGTSDHGPVIVVFPDE